MATARPAPSADPSALDLVALARVSAEVDGLQPLAAMPRLVASVLAVPEDAAPAAWSAQVQRQAMPGGDDEVQLDLQAQAGVLLTCQRCLQPMLQPLSVQRRFRFVRGEDEAARLDEDSEDDVLALPRRLNLLELLEDEFILALPLVPRHDSCPQPLAAAAGLADPAVPDEAPPHPFAALAALKRGDPAAD